MISQAGSHQKLRAAIIDRIMHGWSLEQIAGRLAYDRSRVRLCHETIYRFAYSADGQEVKLWCYLPEARARRWPCSTSVWSQIPPRIKHIASPGWAEFVCLKRE
ncbi:MULTISPECIES: hypothetical protein [unclassified Beijerinckia]|uniref:hypothetical protein n=1 Tax=unclassified Beijerinckia TaxID=2638183 RepID=UPI000B82CFF8|nr:MULTISPECIES: hypothetical protein [unclassified Beijerinckia]MDH7798843.1 IS30 family transposase [Beijerinckia sp. GAS462]